jgi:hypothetical protein
MNAQTTSADRDEAGTPSRDPHATHLHHYLAWPTTSLGWVSLALMGVSVVYFGFELAFKGSIGYLTTAWAPFSLSLLATFASATGLVAIFSRAQERSLLLIVPLTIFVPLSLVLALVSVGELWP